MQTDKQTEGWVSVIRETESRLDIQVATPLSECVAFVKAKLAGAENALIAREQSETSWRDGTDESWRAAGCKLNKSERLKESRMQGRIALKCRYEIKMLKAVLENLADLQHLILERSK